jgi:hypothetical protein
MANHRDTTYAFYYQDGFRITEAARESFFSQMRDGHVREKKGSLVDERDVVVDDQPGRDITIESPRTRESPATVHQVRMVLARGRLYQLMAVSPKDRAAAAEQFITRFFRSFRLNASPAELSQAANSWATYRSRAGGFSVLLPVTATESVRTLELPEGSTRMVLAGADVNGISFLAAYHDVPASAARQPEALLDDVRDVAIENARGRLQSERRINMGRNPGREVTAEIRGSEHLGPGVVKVKAYLVGQRVYQLVVMCPKAEASSAKVEDFFKSFKLIARK